MTARRIHEAEARITRCRARAALCRERGEAALALATTAPNGHIAELQRLHADRMFDAASLHELAIDGHNALIASLRRSGATT